MSNCRSEDQIEATLKRSSLMDEDHSPVICDAEGILNQHSESANIALLKGIAQVVVKVEKALRIFEPKNHKVALLTNHRRLRMRGHIGED